MVTEPLRGRGEQAPIAAFWSPGAVAIPFDISIDFFNHLIDKIEPHKTGQIL